jgi:hypothetical protein
MEKDCFKAFYDQLAMVNGQNSFAITRTVKLENKIYSGIFGIFFNQF